MEMAESSLRMNLVHVHEQLQHDEESSLGSGIIENCSIDLSHDYPRDDENDTQEEGPNKRLDKQSGRDMEDIEDTCITPVKQSIDHHHQQLQLQRPHTEPSPYFTPLQRTPSSFMALSTVWITSLQKNTGAKRITGEPHSYSHTPHNNQSKTTHIDPDEELERQALQIRSALRDSEMIELALLAERAAEAGQEKFAGHASTFSHGDLNRPGMYRSSTYSEGTKPPRHRRLRLSQIRLRKKLPVLALRPIEDVIPSLPNLHSHLGAHLLSTGVNIHFSSVDMPINYHLNDIPNQTYDTHSALQNQEPKMTFLQKVTNWVSSSKTDNSSWDDDRHLLAHDDPQRSQFDVGDMLSEHIISQTVSSPDWQPLPIRIPPGLIIPEGEEMSLEMFLPKAVSTPILRKYYERHDNSISTAPTTASSEPPTESKNEDSTASHYQPELLAQPELHRETSSLTPIALFDGEESIAGKDRTLDLCSINRTDTPKTPMNNSITELSKKIDTANILDLPHLFLTPVRLRGIRDKKISHFLLNDNRSQGWTYTVSGDVSEDSDHNASQNLRSRSDTFGEAILDEGTRSDPTLVFDVNPISKPPATKMVLKPRSSSMSKLYASTVVENLGRPVYNNVVEHDVSAETKMKIGQMVDKVPESISAEEHSLQLSRSGSFGDESSRPRKPEPMSPPGARRRYDEEVMVPFSTSNDPDVTWLATVLRKDSVSDESSFLFQEEESSSSHEDGKILNPTPRTEKAILEVSDFAPQATPDEQSRRGKNPSFNHAEMLRKASEKFDKIPPANTKSERGQITNKHFDACADSQCPQTCGGCGIDLTRSGSNESGAARSKLKNLAEDFVNDKLKPMRRVLSCPSLVDASEYRKESCPSISDGFAVGDNLRALSASSLSPKNRKSNDMTMHSASFISVFDKGLSKSRISKSRSFKPTYDENHAFLNNYLYCSKTAQEVKEQKKKVVEPSMCGATDGTNHCSDAILLDGCQGLANMIEAAKSVLPGKRTEEKELISLEIGEYTSPAESWFDAASERFDGAIERIVGSGKDKSKCKWNGLLDAPSLSMKTPNGSRRKTLDPGRVEGIVLVSQKRMTNSRGPQLHHERFQDMYGSSAQPFGSSLSLEQQSLLGGVTPMQDVKGVNQESFSRPVHRRASSASAIDLTLPSMEHNPAESVAAVPTHVHHTPLNDRQNDKFFLADEN